MTAINCFSDLRQALSEHGTLFVRWSAGPEYDLRPGAASRDYQTGEIHAGLSAVAINNDMGDEELFRFLRDYSYLVDANGAAAACHLYTGTVVGMDSDGADCISPSAHIGAMTDEMTAFLADDTNRERIALMDMIAINERALASYKVSPPAFIPVWTEEKLAKNKARLADLGGPLDY